MRGHCFSLVSKHAIILDQVLLQISFLKLYIFTEILAEIVINFERIRITLFSLDILTCCSSVFADGRPRFESMKTTRVWMTEQKSSAYSPEKNKQKLYLPSLIIWETKFLLEKQIVFFCPPEEIICSLKCIMQQNAQSKHLSEHWIVWNLSSS